MYRIRMYVWTINKNFFFYPEIYYLVTNFLYFHVFFKTSTLFKSYLRHRCRWCCPACCWGRSRRAPCCGVSAAPSPAPHPPAQRAPPCCFTARHYQTKAVKAVTFLRYWVPLWLSVTSYLLFERLTPNSTVNIDLWRKGVTKRFRLSWLTNSALIYCISPNVWGWEERRGCGVSAN